MFASPQMGRLDEWIQAFVRDDVSWLLVYNPDGSIRVYWRDHHGNPDSALFNRAGGFIC